MVSLVHKHSGIPSFRTSRRNEIWVEKSDMCSSRNWELNYKPCLTNARKITFGWVIGRFEKIQVLKNEDSFNNCSVEHRKCLCVYNNDVPILNGLKKVCKLQTKILVWINTKVSSVSRCSKFRCNCIGVLSRNWTGAKNK